MAQANRTKEEFSAFKKRIESEMLTHRVIVNNEYCKWFHDGELTTEDVRYFAQQFSVFSNLFLIAQLKKMINAVDINEMRAAKEILANELGTIFRPPQKESEDSIQKRSVNSEDEGDPELVTTEGTIDGGTFRFAAGHFEWLVKFAKPLGLGFENMGKRRFGSEKTLFFCDELERIYGSEDFSRGAGASFAVENWAADGFWKQLTSGLRIFKKEQMPALHLGFFTWHDKVEDQHKAHTHEELEELYFGPHSAEFSEEKFMAAGKEMLDGVLAFWEGLNEERLQRRRTEKVAS